ncbi:hypothetical protein M5D96_008055, partial [Drosophila gunungcola]
CHVLSQREVFFDPRNVGGHSCVDPGKIGTSTLVAKGNQANGRYSPANHLGDRAQDWAKTGWMTHRPQKRL